MTFRNALSLAGRLVVLCGVALLILSPGRGRADIIPDLNGVSPNGSNYTFTYDASVTNVQKVKTGDYFTIYDFYGFVPGTNFQPTGWTFSTALVGPTPPNVNPTDDPNVINLTWTYTGPDLIGPQDLGLFGADSTLSGVHDTDFAALATKYDPGKPDNGTPVSNVGTTGAPAPVPEPGFVQLGGLLAMGGLGSAFRFLKRRKIA